MDRSLFLFLLFILSWSREVCSEICQYRESCSFNSKKLDPVCYCDNKCIQYKDCCKEYIRYNLQRLPLNNSTFLETCIHLTNDAILGNDRIGAFMVSNCKKTETPCHADGSDLQSLLPVSNNGVTYLNADCAICNNIDNFDFWGIAYFLNRIDDFVTGENGTRRPLSGQDLIEKIFSQERQSFLYYLQPTNDVKLRLCSRNIWTATKHLDTEEIYYQNWIRCNGILYKNYEFCLEDSCCTSQVGRCGNLPYYGKDGKTMLRKGMRIFFDITGKTQANFPSTNQNGFDSALSIGFQGIEVDILIDVKLMINESFLFYDCIQSVMAYLTATEYDLNSKHGNFIQYLLDDKNLFLAEFKSMTKLSPSQANSLLDFREIITYVDNASQKNAAVLLTRLTDPQLIESLRLETKRFIAIDSKFQASPNLTKPCLNASLILKKSNNRAAVEIECLNKEQGLGSEFGNHNRVGFVISNPLFLWMMSLIVNMM